MNTEHNNAPWNLAFLEHESLFKTNLVCIIQAIQLKIPNNYIVAVNQLT